MSIKESVSDSIAKRFGRTPNIVVVSGNPDLNEQVWGVLKGESMDVRKLSNLQGLHTLEQRPDLVILDSDAFDIEDYELMPPTIAASTDTEVRISALEHGATAVLEKPLDNAHIRGQATAVLRRLVTEKEMPNKITIGDIEIDLIGRTVSRNGRTTIVTPNEFVLLTLLLENLDKPVSYRDIERLYERKGHSRHKRSTSVSATKLRKLFEDDTRKPKYLVTLQNLGIMLRSKAPTDGEIPEEDLAV